MLGLLTSEEGIYVSFDSVQRYLRKRHVIMIWAFIFFTLISTAPPNASDSLENVFAENGFPVERDTSCSKADFYNYLRGPEKLPSSPIDQNVRVFGPQLPAFYERYRSRHAEQDDDEINGTVSSNTNTSTGRVTGSDVGGKHRLETDLDRLLEQEQRIKQDEIKENATTSTEPQQQDADPPLPSFNEWTKQKLEEQQQTKQQQQQQQQQHQQQQADGQLKNGVGNGAPAAPSNGGGSVPGPALDGAMKPATIDHQHARNYASKECGAKVLLANPQAQHASSVLNEKEPDEYMLNPCNAEQKFFVVELCETVQITRLDLANYELFSSSPKDFRVFVSERYPSTDWTFLGSFLAEDQRKIQNFPVERRVYAKYVKVELLSHYGSEHFCPLSLIRVLGVSVVEEYEAAAAQDQRQQEKQIEASNVFIPMETPDKAEEKPSPFDRPEVVMEKEASVTPPEPQLQVITPSPDSGSEKNGFNIRHQELLNSAKDAVVHLAKGVIDKAQAVFGGPKSQENETAPNSTDSTSAPLPPSSPPDPPVEPEEVQTVVAAAILTLDGRCYTTDQWRQCLKCEISSNASRRMCGYVRAYLVKRRPKPKKAVDAEFKPSTTDSGIEKTKTDSELVAPNASGERLEEDAPKEEKNQTTDPVQNDDAQASTTLKVPPTAPPVTNSFTNAPVDSSALPGVATSGKETVFARLNNRIRTLETNISLSGEYLGELSLRYRKQMDEMQKALNKSNSAIAQHTKSTEEKLTQYRSEIEILHAELEKVKSMLLEYNAEKQIDIDASSNETVIVDIEKIRSKAEIWAPVIAAVEIVVLVSIVFYCCRGKFGTDERALEDMVERRVRHAIVEELQKLRRNGVALNGLSFGTPTGNGHLPVDRSIATSPARTEYENSPARATDNRWQPSFGRHESNPLAAVQNVVVSFEASTSAVAPKPKKKAKKRQPQKIVAARKSSDQTSGFSSRHAGHVDEVVDVRDDESLNDSSAGILFSTSSPSNALWRRVLPGWRRTASTNQQVPKQRRRGSDERLSAATLNTRSKRKFHSQNAFEVLASPSSSSSNESHSRSPEKRPRAGRGPS